MQLDDSPLPKPRSFFAAAVTMGVLAGVPFTFLWPLLFARQMHRPYAEILPFGLIAGPLFAITFGLTMGFLFKGESAEFDVISLKDFFRRLQDATSRMGYSLAGQSDDVLTYTPSLRAGLAAGRISVQIRDGRAMAVGPKYYINKLRKTLGVG